MVGLKVEAAAAAAGSSWGSICSFVSDWPVSRVKVLSFNICDPPGSFGSGFFVLFCKNITNKRLLWCKLETYYIYNTVCAANVFSPQLSNKLTSRKKSTRYGSCFSFAQTIHRNWISSFSVGAARTSPQSRISFWSRKFETKAKINAPFLRVAKIKTCLLTCTGLWTLMCGRSGWWMCASSFV